MPRVVPVRTDDSSPSLCIYQPALVSSVGAFHSGSSPRLLLYPAGPLPQRNRPATVASQNDCTIVAAAGLALPPRLAVLVALREEPWARSHRLRGIGEWRWCLMGCPFKLKLL